MQLACIFNNLQAQERQKLHVKVSRETQEKLPKEFASERQKCLKINKIRSLSACGAEKCGHKRAKNNCLNQEKSDILVTFSGPPPVSSHSE